MSGGNIVGPGNQIQRVHISILALPQDAEKRNDEDC